MATDYSDDTRPRITDEMLQAASGGLSVAGGTAGLGIGLGLTTGVQPMLARGVDPEELGSTLLQALPGQPVLLNDTPLNLAVNEALGMPRRLRDPLTNDMFDRVTSLAFVPQASEHVQLGATYHPHPAAAAAQMVLGTPQLTVDSGGIPSYMRVGSGDFDMRRILKETAEGMPSYVRNHKLRTALGLVAGYYGAQELADGVGEVQQSGGRLLDRALAKAAAETLAEPPLSPADAATQQVAGAGLGALGALQVWAARDPLTGTRRVYHGTSTDEAAEAIRREGLQPAFGGSGASRADSVFIEGSQNKVHVTPQHSIARVFTSYDPETMPVDMEDWKASRNGWRNRVLEARIPESRWVAEFDPDPFVGEAARFLPAEAQKEVAATTTRAIDPDDIVGGKGFSRRESLRKVLKNFPESYLANPGRMRRGLMGASMGLGMMGTGAYLGLDAAQRKEEEP